MHLAVVDNDIFAAVNSMKNELNFDNLERKYYKIKSFFKEHANFQMHAQYYNNYFRSKLNRSK